jgi:hypothetical protein
MLITIKKSNMHPRINHDYPVFCRMNSYHVPTLTISCVDEIIMPIE